MSPTSKTTSKELNPCTTKFEFFGPPGALFISIVAPSTPYLLYFSCSKESGGCPPSLASLPNRALFALSSLEWWKNLWDTEASLIYLGWYAFCVVAWAILPGEQVEGGVLRTGDKKKYKLNALSTLLLELGITAGIINKYGPEAFTIIYHKWVGFVTAAVSMSIFLAVMVYVMSFQKDKLLALGGNTGNVIYDFFIGRELNPSIRSFDIKSFNEGPGLILWTLIDISMVCEQATRRGGLANVTDSMWLVLVFQSFYVIDSLYNQSAILTTMDITTDGFGFMLAVVILPLFLGSFAYGWVFVVNALGYYIFRNANSEKNDFRNGKNPTNLQYFTTESGSKLLTSGWWGRSRHPNYFGDLLMALAWSLPTGFDTPITYFYVGVFTVMLMHRQHRDDENCKKKYGADWEKYKKMVPYKIIPYVY
ncbi:ERG4/ERG24 ergosterol biosynthesis protein [Hymenopellis radicata]|nr:ERG4/ERG24 ergosterol biosynthesis protein [Hymenopellis radicata]